MKHPTVKQTEIIATVIGALILLAVYLAVTFFVLKTVIGSLFWCSVTVAVSSLAIAQLYTSFKQAWSDIND